MLPDAQKERCKILLCPESGVTEDLEDRKPCGVYTDTSLYGSPGCSWERLLRHESKVLDELVCRPGGTEGLHFREKFLCIFLILCQGIGPGKRLPIDCTEKRPAPFIVTAGFCSRVEHPVNGTVELVAEDIMGHDLLCVSHYFIVLQLFCVLNTK